MHTLRRATNRRICSGQWTASIPIAMLRRATHDLGAMSIRLGLSVILVVAALTAGCGFAEARTRALVVGVSGYPALPEQLHLNGPKNDAREVANTLVRVGVAPGDVTVLADGVEGLADGVAAPRPWHQRSHPRRARQARRHQRAGDLVVFYFSGHGSQQPDENGDEQGGNDEIVLPYDVGKWERPRRRERAGRRRAQPSRAQAPRQGRRLLRHHRRLPFGDRLPRGRRRRRALARSRSGRSSAFRQVALAAEAPGNLLTDMGSASPAAAAPPSSTPPRNRRWRSRTRRRAPSPARALASSPTICCAASTRTPDVTYRTLHQAVIDDIKRGSLMATQTPELEGELLDEPVLRLTDAKPLRQWPIFAGKLQAGELSGLSNGTMVALYNDPADPDDKVLAYGEIEQAAPRRAVSRRSPIPAARHRTLTAAARRLPTKPPSRRAASRASSSRRRPFCRAVGAGARRSE